MNGTSDGGRRVDLLGMSLAQLRQFCADLGMPRFAASQVCDWLYKKRVGSIDAMTNLSLASRSRLNEVACIGRTEPLSVVSSADGTRKYLFRTAGGHSVEAVFIPDGDRATLCLSSQAGCKMGCRFCMTGSIGFLSSLSAGEILNQLFSLPECELITNVVFMGMGEPMDNLDAVLAATDVLTADWGLGWSPKRITVSTVGVLPALRRFVEESRCHLAVSLHNIDHEGRAAMMPVERAWPLADVLELLRGYDWSGQRRLTFEYTMIAGVNDSPLHAVRLATALRGLPCRVNLIRFHEGVRRDDYLPSPPQAIAAFQRSLEQHGVLCTLRASRGQDIEAACGLLAAKGSNNQQSINQ